MILEFKPGDKVVNPMNKADTKPRGDITKNSFSEMRLGLDTLGCSVVDSNIGRRAKDNKIDMRINKSILAGSLKFNKN